MPLKLLLRVYERPEVVTPQCVVCSVAKHTADVETGYFAEAAGHTTMNILLDH